MKRRWQGAAFAGDRNPHRQPGVVRINGTKASDFLHVVAAPAHWHSGVKKRSERLEPREAFLAELLEQCCAIEVKPNGLQVNDRPQARRLRDAVRAHEITMGDTRPGIAQGQFARNLLINSKEGRHRCVADTVGCELHALGGHSAHHALQRFSGDLLDATVGRVADPVHLAHTPRLLHVGTASEHPAVEPDFGSDDLEHPVGLAQWMGRNLLDCQLGSAPLRACGKRV